GEGAGEHEGKEGPCRDLRHASSHGILFGEDGKAGPGTAGQREAPSIYIQV
ncbi:MAG: hypothetical protein K0R58_2314, partial [Ramlibacter sp.]|nr:hypothetical protein [Ramlibacter sp.]